MKVTTEIDDDDLDTRFPDEHDGDHEPTATVMTTVRTADGMGYTGAVHLYGSLLTPAAVAEAVVSAAQGATRTHSPAAGRALDRWLTVPPDMEIVPGGED